MRAAWYERNGAARDVLVVGDTETPEPGPGEVRIRLSSSGLNPSDVKSRAGLTRAIAFPRVIPNSDGAGVIDAVGEGVPAGRRGERVWTFNAQWQRPFGTSAQYVVVRAEYAVPLPDNADFDQGACMGIPAMTAHRCLFADGPVSGLTVLVTGGAGTVGNAAIQLAKWGGATVIATVSSEAKAAVAGSAGADHVINYRSQDVAAQIREATGGKGVDRVVEVGFGPNLPVTLSVLKPNSVVASYASDGPGDPNPIVPFTTLLRSGTTLRFVLVYLLPEAARRAALEDITACIRAGGLKHHISRRFTLDQIVEAHETLERGTEIGNFVIDLQA